MYKVTGMLSKGMGYSDTEAFEMQMFMLWFYEEPTEDDIKRAILPFCVNGLMVHSWTTALYVNDV